VTTAVISRRARRELLDAMEWIARDNPVAAEGLHEAVIRAATLIGARPGIGSLRPDLAPPSYRFLSLRGYPYVIVYSAREAQTRIVRVVHSSRDLRNALKELQ
jgi:toxin ParE1/3/4